jgi:hypothetical protein
MKCGQTRGERNDVKERTRNWEQREQTHSVLNPMAEVFEPSNSDSEADERRTGEKF